MKILTFLLGLLTVHFAIFFIVGLFAKKTFPHTDKKLRYGVVISARNEELVIGNLIDSIRKNKYPQDRIDIFVVAHNCTDKTAEVARAAGAVVYEYRNDKEHTKGYAMHYLFDCIKKDYGINSYDGYFMFDADNILAENFIDKMNDAFVATGCTNVVTSFRNAKNLGENLMSSMYGLYFMQGCRFESRGRTVTGCSTKITGTGFMFSADSVKDGWKYVTLTEDWEFAADQIINGHKVIYCDEAEFYDEQPVSVKIMFRQRLRWAKGHLLICISRMKDLLKGIFLPVKKGGSANKISVYDLTAKVLPVLVFSVSLFIIKAILISFAPLLGFSAAQVWTDWAIGVAQSFGLYYLSTFFTGVLLVIAERKRIKNNIGGGLLVLAVFVWPIFLLVAFPLEFGAMFVRNLQWKAIPHKNTASLEQLNACKHNNKSAYPSPEVCAKTNLSAERSVTDDNLSDVDDIAV